MKTIIPILSKGFDFFGFGLSRDYEILHLPGRYDHGFISGQRLGLDNERVLLNNLLPERTTSFNTPVFQKNSYGSKMTFIAWIILCAYRILGYLVSFIVSDYSTPLILILVIINVLVTIVFLVAFYRTKNLFNEYH